MTDAMEQGQGTGSAIVGELCAALEGFGFAHVRLGYVKGNGQSRHFWKKNRFAETGVEYDTDGYTVVCCSGGWGLIPRQRKGTKYEDH